jgi:integrase
LPEATQKIERHWRSFFSNTIALNGVTRKEPREFSIVLHDKGLSSSTINNIMIVGTSALKWAFTERLIPVDPAEGLTTFTGEGKSRDILTEEEIEALFQVEWQEKRAYIAAPVSLTTGIRSGEVRALRRESTLLSSTVKSPTGLVPGSCSGVICSGPLKRRPIIPWAGPRNRITETAGYAVQTRKA